MLGERLKTTELYTPVQDENLAKKMADELRQKGITVDTKRTHSTYDVVPSGSLIVFATKALETPMIADEENIEKLKSYISNNGGKIDDMIKTFPSIKTFIQNLFGRG